MGDENDDGGESGEGNVIRQLMERGGGGGRHAMRVSGKLIDGRCLFGSWVGLCDGGAARRWSPHACVRSVRR